MGDSLITSNLTNKDGFSIVSSQMSEAGKYSYCTMCTVAMHELYNNEWDRPFTERCLNFLILHLQLPDSVKNVMQAILDGEFQPSVEPCLVVLKDEPDFKFLLRDLIFVAVKDGSYDSRWRVMVHYLAEQMNIPQTSIEMYETSVIYCLTKDRFEKSEADKEQSRGKQKMARLKKFALIGAASVGGGALLAITGGLAAPMVGAGLTSLGLGSVVGGGAALLGSAGGIAMISSLCGAAGAGLTGYKMHKRVGDIEEFAFDRLELEQAENNNDPVVNAISKYSQLHISILISGWLNEESPEAYIRHWVCARCSREQYCLRYESRYLVDFGRAVEYLISMALTGATQKLLQYTALSGLLSAIMWPSAVLGLASIIDNPWGVCCRRSAQVGRQLAEVLLAREQGQRPVTLVGFSIGARVIYYCLREMAEREKCEGIVQDAIFIGTPCSAKPNVWKSFTRVVAGRIINGYCKNDWLLKFLYRTTSMPSHGVAGLAAIQLDDHKISNVDLTDIVSGHMDYSDKLCLILRTMNVRVKDGPCGEAKLLRAQTSDQLAGNAEQQDISSQGMRKTQSDSRLSQNQSKSC